MDRRRIVLLLLVGALLLAGCGSSASSTSNGPSGTPAAQSQTRFAKTKFVLHAGLAFGVFHRWIYKPYKAGTLQHPLLHKLAFVKALAAGGVVLHEVRLALQDARSSKLLSKVVVPLTAMAGSVTAIRAALRNHGVDAGAINSAEDSIRRAGAASRSAGQPITESTAVAGF